VKEQGNQTYPVLGGPDGSELQEALASGNPHVAYCETCDDRFYYPRATCPRCLGEDVRLVEHRSPLTVASFSSVHRVQSPVFAERSPALVLTLQSGNLRMIVEAEGWEDQPPVIGSLAILACRRRPEGSYVLVARPVSVGR
jgi:uncharacterized OB-fold protein